MVVAIILVVAVVVRIVEERVRGLVALDALDTLLRISVHIDKTKNRR